MTKRLYNFKTLKLFEIFNFSSLHHIFDNIFNIFLLLIFGGLSFEWHNNHYILFYNHKKQKLMFKDQFLQQICN